MGGGVEGYSFLGICLDFFFNLLLFIQLNRFDGSTVCCHYRCSRDLCNYLYFLSADPVVLVLCFARFP